MTGIAELNRSAALGSAAAAVIRCAEPGDAPAIAALYRAVQIRPRAGRLALWDFSLRGGMFEIPDRPRIKRECAPSLRCFSVAECGGQVEALMRLSEDLSEYGGLAERFPGSLGYVELAVRARAPHLAYPFLLASFQAVQRAGWQGLLFQIYHLSRLRTAAGDIPLSIDNRPSVGLNTRLGAVRVGELPEKEVAMRQCRLYIRPDVYHLPLPMANARLDGLCKDAGWEWTDENTK